MKADWLDDGATLTQQDLADNGVHHARLSTDESDYREPLDELKSQRGYVEEDEVSLSPDTPNLDAICAKFIDEHYHDEDEVRFVLEGDGIFDIRSVDDRWMRVKVEEGDLIVVPRKRYHRFMLTEDKRIRCVRLFKDQSGWTPQYRSS